MLDKVSNHRGRCRHSSRGLAAKYKTEVLYKGYLNTSHIATVFTCSYYLSFQFFVFQVLLCLSHFCFQAIRKCFHHLIGLFWFVVFRVSFNMPEVFSATGKNRHLVAVRERASPNSNNSFGGVELVVLFLSIVLVDDNLLSAVLEDTMSCEEMKKQDLLFVFFCLTHFLFARLIAGFHFFESGILKNVDIFV
jgi:hypothetical protein